MKFTGAAGVLLAVILLGACHSVEPPAWKDRQAVAARTNALFDRNDESPSREFINRLHSEDYPARLKWITDANHIWTPDDLSLYRNYVTILELAEKGKAWPAPPKVIVPRAKSPVKIDGSLTDEAWSRAFVWQTNYLFNETSPAPHTTIWKLLWDENYLYVGFACSDDQIQSRQRLRDAAVYDDDCVELFISPDIRFRSYWEIVVNPDGNIYDAINCKRANLWGPDPDPKADVAGLQVCTQRVGPNGLAGYTTELAVPWSAILPLNTSAHPRDRFSFLLARLDWKGRALAPLSPIPLLGWAHNIWNMAVMELGD